MVSHPATGHRLLQGFFKGNLRLLRISGLNVPERKPVSEQEKHQPKMENCFFQSNCHFPKSLDRFWGWRVGKPLAYQERPGCLAGLRHPQGRANPTNESFESTSRSNILEVIFPPLKNLRIVRTSYGKRCSSWQKRELVHKFIDLQSWQIGGTASHSDQRNRRTSSSPNCTVSPRWPHVSTMMNRTLVVGWFVVILC